MIKGFAGSNVGSFWRWKQGNSPAMCKILHVPQPPRIVGGVARTVAPVNPLPLFLFARVISGGGGFKLEG